MTHDSHNLHENTNILHTEQHTHIMPDGTVITHEHPLEYDHDAQCRQKPVEHIVPEDCENEECIHYYKDPKVIINRMNRAIGHMESIKTMIEHERNCEEVLTQIAAVRSAINNIGKIVLQDYIEQNMQEAIGKEIPVDDAMVDIKNVINKFVK